MDLCDAHSNAIHFADFQRQPWKKPGHPFGALFLKELKSAVESEEIPLDALEHEIRYGHVYPDIVNDIQQIDGK